MSDMAQQLQDAIDGGDAGEFAEHLALVSQIRKQGTAETLAESARASVRLRILGTLPSDSSPPSVRGRTTNLRRTVLVFATVALVLSTSTVGLAATDTTIGRNLRKAGRTLHLISQPAHNAKQPSRKAAHKSKDITPRTESPTTSPASTLPHEAPTAHHQRQAASVPPELEPVITILPPEPIESSEGNNTEIPAEEPVYEDPVVEEPVYEDPVVEEPPPNATEPPPDNGTSNNFSKSNAAATDDIAASNS